MQTPSYWYLIKADLKDVLFFLMCAVPFVLSVIFGCIIGQCICKYLDWR